MASLERMGEANVWGSFQDWERDSGWLCKRGALEEIGNTGNSHSPSFCRREYRFIHTWCWGQDEFLSVDPERAELGSRCRKQQKSEKKKKKMMKRNKKGKMMWINISVEDAWFHFSPIHCEKHRGTQRMVRKRKQFLEASWQDVRGYWQGVAFSDICSAEEISSCLQEITVVGIPTVNVAAHPIQRRHCKLQISRRIWCAYEEMLRMRAMNTGMHLEFFRKTFILLSIYPWYITSFKIH